MIPAMRRHAWLFALGSLGLYVTLVANCGGEPSGEPLTVATIGAGPSSTTTTGDGGASGGTGGGTTTTTTTTTGQGGMGGAPEQTINGCLSTTATDMTGMTDVTVDIPNGPFCVKVDLGTQVTITLTPVSGTCPGSCPHRYVGGVYDPVTQIKTPDGNSPFKTNPQDIFGTCSNNSPYNDCPASNGPFTMAQAGAFGWYDDKNAATLNGVVYVD
jgi:hypothetical protein